VGGAQVGSPSRGAAPFPWRPARRIPAPVSPRGAAKLTHCPQPPHPRQPRLESLLLLLGLGGRAPRWCSRPPPTTMGVVRTLLNPVSGRASYSKAILGRDVALFKEVDIALRSSHCKFLSPLVPLDDCADSSEPWRPKHAPPGHRHLRSSGPLSRIKGSTGQGSRELLDFRLLRSTRALGGFTGGGRYSEECFTSHAAMHR
jgi:hypothetical protein